MMFLRAQRLGALGAVTVLILAAEGALAAPQIYVAWALPGTPVPGQHYVIDDSDPEWPSIQLVAGDITWWVWSRDDVTGAISDIGDITAFGEADYGLILTDRDGNPGARHVQSIILTPVGGNWSGISVYSQDTPSRITGSLSGNLTLLQVGGSTGGFCQLTVDQNVSGTWNAPGDVAIQIHGAVTDTASITEGTITAKLCRAGSARR